MNAIQAQNLSKQYKIGVIQQRHDTLREQLTEGFKWLFRRNGRMTPSEDTIWALKNVSFQVRSGEVVGIIGRNGAGKSTLLKILSRITKPTEGYAEVHGRVGSLLEVGTGFHPELTGRENIYLNGAILGMKKAEIQHKFDEIVAFAEIEKFIDTPVKRYSSGMYVRLAFAVAAHLEPEILIVDEVLAVGDLAFQRKCLGKMEKVAGQGRTVLLVSHNMDAIYKMCQRVLLLDAGRLDRDAAAPEVIRYYLGFADRAAYRRLGLSSEAITLHEIRLIGARGEVINTFRYDERFYIEVKYHVQQRALGLSIGLEVKAESGVPVFTTVSRSAVGTRELAEGPGISRVEIPSHFLSPGKYSVFVNAHNMHEAFCHTENAVSFQILDMGREILGREGQMRWPGVISPFLRWENVPQQEVTEL